MTILRRIARALLDVAGILLIGLLLTITLAVQAVFGREE